MLREVGYAGPVLPYHMPSTPAHLRILCLSGVLPRGKAITTLNLFDEVRAMTWRPLHP